MERHCKIIFKINDSKKAKKYNLNQVFLLRIKVGKSGRIIKIKQIKATPKIIADRVATGNKIGCQVCGYTAGHSGLNN